jgi:hypothetical protein
VMNNLTLDGLIFLGSLLAGFLGALTGLGGGVVLVPLLVLGYAHNDSQNRGEQARLRCIIAHRPLTPPLQRLQCLQRVQ